MGGRVPRRSWGVRLPSLLSVTLYPPCSLPFPILPPQVIEICAKFTRGVDFNWQAQALLALQEVREGLGNRAGWEPEEEPSGILQGWQECGRLHPLPGASWRGFCVLAAELPARAVSLRSSERSGPVQPVSKERQPGPWSKCPFSPCPRPQKHF